MKFKNIALIILLLPVASYGKSTETRIKELKETKFKKEVELSEIGEMISKRDEFLSSFPSYTQDLLSTLKDNKIAELESKNNGKKLSDEEKKELTATLLKSANEFLFAFCDACKDNKNIKDLLINGLFTEETEGVKKLESLKFFLVKCAFERNLTVALVKKYEECIQELIKIDLELTELTK